MTREVEILRLRLRMTKVVFRTSALLSFLVIPNERSEVKNLNLINKENTYIEKYGKNRG